MFNGLQRASTDLSKDNLFNNYFASMFSEGDSAHYPGNISNPDLTGRMDITEQNVSAILEKLNPAKSHGPDAIPSRLLKNLATVLSPSLSRILSTCVNKGRFPEPWKTVLLSPVHKSGNRSNIKNYRPFALLNCVSKMFEKIIFDALYKKVEQILSQMQYGFRRKRSIVVQMLEFVHKLYRNSEDKTITELNVLYVDFEKAFDKVSHKLLLQKLLSIGVCGKLYDILYSYLSGRRQCVKVNGSVSDPVSVRSGVSQGSLLGPSLFLLYVNDLPDLFSGHPVMFADDLKNLTINNNEIPRDAELLSS